MNSDRPIQSRNSAPSSEPTGTCTIDPQFDFDSWAIAVRRQLLASLHKRTERSS
ncbi:hypothetical protein H6F67_18335 [Microcoleus sp. FACHB-1515]|uniref:hypothetical protein n=1 Tax=Cyanophyceae TaxID=3028117 RepID=UPI0016871D13|nr:hypothetical protein [Microcoleus sp. FACHB-1515]MBD2091805.1 hypothetical protein [Microcoleus sp. FACHB-1515]